MVAGAHHSVALTAQSQVSVLRPGSHPLSWDRAGDLTWCLSVCGVCDCGLPACVCASVCVFVLQVFTWGSNSSGQLGHMESPSSIPRLAKVTSHSLPHTHLTCQHSQLCVPS